MSFPSPEYIPGVQRTRHAYVEQRINETFNLLNFSGAASSVVDAATVASFNAMADNYFVPDIVDGMVILTDSQKLSDAQPIVAVDPCETLLFGPDFAVFSPGQRQIVTTSLEGSDLAGISDVCIDSWQRSIAAQFSEEPYELMMAQIGANAYVYNHVGTLDLSGFGLGEQHFRMRSILAVEFRGPSDVPLADTTLLHEDIHLVQSDSQPLVGADTSYSRVNLQEEHEAYSKVADTLTALEADGRELRLYEKFLLEAPEIAQEVLDTVDGSVLDELDVFRYRMKTRKTEMFTRG